MPHLPYHQQQLEFVTQLANNRIEFLNPLFSFLSYFDSPYFFFVLIPAIWLGFSYQWGLRLFYWLTFNNIVLNFAKHSVSWSRPSSDSPEIAFFHPTSPGFPSGGAEGAMFLGGMLIYYWRTRAAWIVGSIYILLISFSRLYLGVHYPIDILGGWILAWIMLALFIIAKDPLEKWLKKKGLHFCLILGITVPVILLFLIPKPNTYYTMGSVMGITIGTYFSLKHHLFLPKPTTFKEGVGRSIIGIAILFLFVFLLPDEHLFIKSLISGLFMSLAASPICKWFKPRKAS